MINRSRNILIRRLQISLIFLVLFALGIFIFKQNIISILSPNQNNQNSGSDNLNQDKINQNPTGDPIIDKMTISDGVEVKTFAKGIRDAKVIVFDKNGRMLVSQTSEGRISILEDQNNDGIAELKRTLVSGLSKPHGLAINCVDTSCVLYVAEQSKLTSFNYDSSVGVVSGMKKLLDIPSTATDLNFTRTLKFLPDNKILLISVGSSCNTCEENDKMRGRIMAYDTTTSKISEYARGLRSSVFMAINSEGKIFATEQGRTGLDKSISTSEINIIEPGKNYGWPICYGKNIHDDVYDTRIYFRNPCMEPFETGSFLDLDPLSKPHGLSFVPQSFGLYSGDLLVADHGSNKIIRISLDQAGNYIRTEDLISNLNPTDLVFNSQNILYISDDILGNIYSVKKLNN